MKAPTLHALAALLLTFSLAVLAVAPAAPDQGRDRQAQGQRTQPGEPARQPAAKEQRQRHKIDTDRGRQYHMTPHIRRYYASTRS